MNDKVSTTRDHNVSPVKSDIAAGPAPGLTVVLIDGRAWTREAFARALETAGRDLRVVCVSDAAELSRADAKGDAVVLLNMTGVPRADPRVSTVVATARSRLPGLPIVALSDRMSVEDILDVIEQGMQGYIPISMEVALVVDALHFVAAGGTFVPAELVLASLEAGTPLGSPSDVAGRPAAPSPLDKKAAVVRELLNELTPRERSVLHVLRQGKSNKHIARELNMCEATVKVHVRHIMRKLGVTNRTEVALLAENFIEN